MQNKIVQIGYLVEDIEAACNHWAEKMGVGPFFIIPSTDYQSLNYRGSASSANVKLAMAQAGSVQIELVQCLDDQPSVFSEFRNQYSSGLHHVAMLTDDIESSLQDYAAKNIEVVQQGIDGTGGKTAFLNTDMHPGGILELIEVNELQTQFFDIVKESADNWDGQTAIIQL